MRKIFVDKKDFPIKELFNKYKNGTLLLSPKYQRGVSWDINKEVYELLMNTFSKLKENNHSRKASCLNQAYIDMFCQEFNHKILSKPLNELIVY